MKVRRFYLSDSTHSDRSVGDLRQRRGILKGLGFGFLFAAEEVSVVLFTFIELETSGMPFG